MKDRIKKLFSCTDSTKSTTQVSKSTKTSPLLLEDFLAASFPKNDAVPDIMDMDDKAVIHFNKSNYTKSSSSFTCCLFSSKKEEVSQKTDVGYDFEGGLSMAELPEEEGDKYQPLPER